MSNHDGEAPLPEAYQGSETSYIKHELLRAYLKRLFLIIGMSAERLGVSEICYVDCFAGPWRDESDDLGRTSIAISLKILDECRRELEQRGRRVLIRALYVEKKKASFARLNQFLAVRPASEIVTDALEGDFVSLRQKILAWCGDEAFVFFFVDPIGWTPVQVNVLAPLIERPRSEFLINFMYDGLNRAVSMKNFQRHMINLLGESPNVAGLEGVAREERIVGIYRENLKLRMDTKWPARSAYVRVLDPIKERAKYHLVYLTSHPHGIVIFMEISEKLQAVQKRVRASTKQRARVDRTGQGELFAASDVPARGNELIDIAAVEEVWLARLSNKPKKFNEAEFATLIEETNLFPGDLQSALGNLVHSKKVRNLDAKGQRRSKFLHLQGQGERLQLWQEGK